MTNLGTSTFLFTDLVGSTTLSSELGAEATEGIRLVHFGLLREAIADHRGEEVKNLGDGLMVAFAGVSGAVGCAVGMQQNIDRHNRSHSGPSLAIRIGLSVGEATNDDGDYFGTPVIEAARLCAAAEGGQILATEVVKVLCGSRGNHSFDPLGALDLKGLTDPVPACSVRWEPLATLGPPLQASVDVTHAVEFVGRPDERELIGQAFKSATEGERRAVLISGEPGMGKTRLVTEAARAAHADGAIVLFGRCDDEMAVPYQPFVEALGHLLAISSDEQVAAIVGKGGADLARILPELATRIADLAAATPGEPDTERYLLFEAVSTALFNASKTAPIVLILDDLHWATKTTLLLLKHVLRSPLPTRVVILGTFRDSDLTRTHPLTDVLADLRRVEGVERVSLHGLSDAEVLAFFETAARQTMDDNGVALSHAVYRETEGSPFFVSEILLHLVESGAVYRENGRWTYTGDVESLGIPDSIREVIGRRLSRLSETANSVLSVAAVIGREFDLAVASQVSEVPDTAALDAVEEAVTANIATEVVGAPGRFTFIHAIVRHTLYDELSATRRMRMHQRIAETLESTIGTDGGQHLSELAHHWAAATPVAPIVSANVNKARHYTELAARRAVETLAYEEAVKHFDHSRELLALTGEVDNALLAELLLSLGDAQWRAGDTPAARLTFAQAADIFRSLHDAGRFARSALGYGAGLGGYGFASFPDAQLKALLEEALTMLPDDDSPTRVRVLARLACALYYTDHDHAEHAARCLSLTEAAVAMAERIGDSRVLLAAKYARLTVMIGPDVPLDARIAASEELYELAADAGDIELVFRGHLYHILGLQERGDAAAASEEIELVRALNFELQMPLYRWVIVLQDGKSALLEGRFEDAEQLMQQALAIGEQAAPESALLNYGGQVMTSALGRGTLGELEPAVRTFADQYQWIPAYRSALALANAELERLDEAGTALAQVVVDGFANFNRDGNWLVGMFVASLACGFVDDTHAAQALYDVLLPFAARDATITFACHLGSVATALGVAASVLRRFEDAEAHFSHAIAHNTQIGARPWTALAQKELAKMLLRRAGPGDRERALELATTLKQEATALNASGAIIAADKLEVLAGRS